MHNTSRTENVAAVAAERLSGRRPGNAIGSQPDPTLEALDRDRRLRPLEPVDRAVVQPARPERDLQCGDARIAGGRRRRREHEDGEDER